MRILALFIILLSTNLFAQNTNDSVKVKKVIDHTVYNFWKSKSDVRLSNDGMYTSYVIKPHRGDGFLYIVNNVTGKKDSIFRASGARFTSDSKSLVFKITAGFDTLRNCELKKVKKDKWPKDSLGVLYLQNDSLVKFPKLKSFSVTDEGALLAYLSHDNKIPEDKALSKKKKKKKKKKKNAPEEPTSDGNLLTIMKSDFSGKTYVKNVTDYTFSENGEKLAYITHQKNKADSSQIWVMDMSLKNDYELHDKFISIPVMNFDKSGNKLVYLASQDTVADAKVYQMHLFDLSTNKKSLLVDVLQGELALTKSVSQNLTPYFSLDGTKVFFGIANKPKVAPKDSLLENEKAKLDVWNWKDDRLQPQQLVELSRDEKQTHLGVFDLNNNSFVIIENDSIELSHNLKNPSPFVLAYNQSPYEAKYNWEYPNKSDVYLVNVFNGDKKLLIKGTAFGVDLSPSGKYFTFFNEKEQQQYLQEIEGGKSTCITCSIKTEWLEDVNGMPVLAGPYGSVAWMKGEESLLIQSKYDWYKFDFKTAKLSSFLDAEAEKKKVRYAINYWNRDSLYFDFENAYVTAFFENDKSEAIYKLINHGDHSDIVELIKSNHTFSGIQKAKKSEVLTFQKASNYEYAESYITKLNNTEKITCISKTNPQQSEYNWSTVDLIHWKSYSGIPLEGLLYKPENFDPTKKYPLLVYYYELNGDELHNHYAPKPTASVIHPTEYASAGYLVLIPDIRYKPGYPARGAFDCIMSATDYVLKTIPAADSTRMGLQGQSWGGYQTAQLITMTTRYKAAMAGAPVGNMISAYGGIRWGSGLNRQFQYERTQSRIGKTIWEAPELYVENSPIYHLPKVKTPLLIMHNDADGAVPWYQGIELFTDMKRLGKPVWMLNYNGDDHNLMKNANRIDLSIRMRQFFDHYLLGTPAPIWLEDGLPALQKGKNYGLDLKQ
jgi:dipeptidyl aminopeptidase/acylaminoacyl peptidase